MKNRTKKKTGNSKSESNTNTLPSPTRIDPTRTITLRRAINREIKQRYSRLRFEIQEKLVNQRELHNGQWRLIDRPQQITQFKEWLQAKINQIILGNVSVYENYLAQSYVKGANSAYSQVPNNSLPITLLFGEMNNSGRAEYLRQLQRHKVNQQSSNFSVNAKKKSKHSTNNPITTKYKPLRSVRGQFMSERVKLLSIRLESELSNATTDMAQRIARELINGMDRGLEIEAIAEAIEDIVEFIGSNRAMTIAETEIVRAHAEGQLDGLEQLGVSEVQAAVEWETTGTPCKLCAPMDGVVLKINEARGMIPRHPRCKCAWKVVTEKAEGQKRQRYKIEKAINLSLKREGVGGEDDEIGGWGSGDTISRDRPTLNLQRDSLSIVDQYMAYIDWLLTNGGAGSGNFGHGGRPGAVGGSSSIGSGSALVSGLNSKLVDQPTTIREKAKQFATKLATGIVTTISAHGHKIYPEILDTADDWLKLSMAKGHDALAASTGIPSSLAVAITSHIMAKAKVYLKAKIKQRNQSTTTATTTNSNSSRESMMTTTTNVDRNQLVYDIQWFLNELSSLIPEIGLEVPTINELNEWLDQQDKALEELTTHGGSGSGNHGHGGRPGQVGGSSSGGFTLVGAAEHAMADMVSNTVANRLGGLTEEQTDTAGQKDKKPYDVRVKAKGKGFHDIEVKSMLKRKEDALSIHDDALLRKVEHQQREPKNVFHTVCLDERANFADGQYKEYYSGHHIYYRRGSGKYSLSNMHKVESWEELKKLLDMPDSKLPEKARGSLPPPPPIEELKAKAKAASESRKARDKARKEKNKDKLREQARARAEKRKAEKLNQ